MLASDVQATPPTAHTNSDIDPDKQEGSIRFALIAEAGLNDGLAFPFTNLAIAMATATVVTGPSRLKFPLIGPVYLVGDMAWLVK